MESLGLSQKDVQSRNKWRRRIEGQPANPGSPGKVAVKTECVCVIKLDSRGYFYRLDQATCPGQKVCEKNANWVWFPISVL